MNLDSAAEHQSISQTTISNFSTDGQAWLPTANQSVKPVTPVHNSEEPCPIAANQVRYFEFICCFPFFKQVTYGMDC